MLQNFGLATLADLFDDWVVYRNLEPLDKRVPGFKNSAYRMGINDDRLPRKQDIDYAKATTWIMEEAQQVRGAKKPIRELLFIGDTLFNDGQAYSNMAKVAGWKGSCFIGADRKDQDATFSLDGATNLYSANRWADISNWVQLLRTQGMALDETTAIVVDIDKTALGAKGRNDSVIDSARLQGIFRAMTNVLGAAGFDRDEFVAQYNQLNRARYHFLTSDNQDYLAYICLVLQTGLIGFEEMNSEIEAHSLENFDQFIRWVDSRIMMNPTGGTALLETHESIMTSVRVGDPTPFKAFRRQEFVATVEHMGNMPDTASIEELLAGEITLTEEVWQVSDWLKQRGSFLICLSDKPDEASRPSKGHTTGLPPIHRAPTHRVGHDLSDALKEIK